ncbi:MAG TPA: hypothetical protein VLM89_12845 [Phycisphaerae bacterium]|nr:hypothetical protein [Phycisphaerae bacterium]
MFRKIILGIASLALFGVAFLVYVWREDPGVADRRRERPTVPQLTITTTQPGTERPVFSFQGAEIPPGQAPKIRVYDPRTGEARIIFQADEWNPVSENEFHLDHPSARVLLPGGQLAYVRANEGQIKVSGSDTKNLNPKSGWFKGDVQVFIDRSKPEWRRQNPDRAAPEQNPESVVRIWLDDAHFDMDLARLESEGKVLVQSAQGSLEGKGLELIWSEQDRRLRRLRIHEGKRATIRGAGLGNLSEVSGSLVAAETQPASVAETAATDAAEPQPEPEPAESADAATQPEQTRQDGIVFLDQEPRRLKEDRIDSYTLIFRDGVVARQLEGVRETGALRATTLRLLSDFGREERAAVEYTPGTGGGEVPRRKTASAPAAAASTRPSTAPAQEKDESTIEVVWAGEVLIEPAPPPTTQEAAAAEGRKRFHLRAEGEPVQLEDAKQGRIACTSLEYHMEAKQGWLTGTADEPVVLNAGPDRQVLAEQTLFFDQKAALARVTGPGRMISRKSQRGLPEDASRAIAGDPLIDPASDIQVSWKSEAEISFEQMRSGDPAKSDAATPGKRSAYLKEARFSGEVVAGMADQSISADRLMVRFLPPPAQAADRQEKVSTPLVSADLIGGVQADHISAAGKVRMTQRSTRQSRQERREIQDSVVCDRLEVDLGHDENGRSYPKVGRAFGHVLARQVIQPYLGSYRAGTPFIRDIRADDQIIIELASVPRPVTDAEVEKLTAAARKMGYTPESPEWKTREQQLRNRRQLVRKRLTARGNVSAHDTQQDLKNLLGQDLECTFDDDQKISRAFLVGAPGEPAMIEQREFYIRGQKLSLDMSTETVEVPGKGTLRFYTDQDIDGRQVEKKMPVVVAWDRQMWLRGSQNIGLFEGAVTVTSENNRMEARELRLTFAPASPEAAAPATQPAGGWLAGPVLDWFRSDDRKSRDGGMLETRQDRRLARVDSFGDVVILSSSYEGPEASLSGRIARSVVNRLPAMLHSPAGQPREPDRTRLLSRIRLAGPQMRIDLADSQLLVEGPGNLLIEDYRIPKVGPRRAADGGLLSSSMVPGLDNMGPSQTYFTWQNSMSFLNKQNLATFDHNVSMRHLAGERMALLESTMKLDEATRKRLTSRAATLGCDNLVAQFETDRSRDGRPAGPSPLSRATGLKAFWARRDVRLEDREATMHRSATGSLIYYDGQSGDARITGTDAQPAHILVVDPQTGQAILNWRGSEVTWNLKTSEVRAMDSVILAPGR